MEPTTLTTGDGTPITVRWFEPVGTTVGAVVIAPAMGVPQTWYAALAGWLAGLGHVVATFDYRGMGLSRHGPLRGFEASISDWATLDAEAVLHEALTRADGKPLVWLGHSLGGQILPMVPSHPRVARLLTVASGSGYWRECAPFLRRFGPFLWHVATPITLAVAGYFPGRRLRTVGDLPAGVMRQWRRWCLDPDYLVGVEGDALADAFARFTSPVHALYLSDDEFMTDAGIEGLHAHYRAAPRMLTRISPADVGIDRIGHFGFFRREREADLWPRFLPQALGLAENSPAPD